MLTEALLVAGTSSSPATTCMQSRRQSTGSSSSITRHTVQWRHSVIRLW